MSRYIDADKLKKAWYTKHNITEEDCGACFVGYSELPRLIDNAPTADVLENVNGRWVEVVDRTEMYDKEGVKTWGMLFQCNQCGFVLNAIEGNTGQYNFCPNCGAKMRKGGAE